jgi:amidase
MATMTDLCHLPAHELVRLMTGRVVSSREVMEAHLARIDEVNPVINALIEAADPEKCLPIAIKDVMRVDGLACSGGSPVLRAVAHDDATVVARLRSEGAIVLGLTNVPEMCTT